MKHKLSSITIIITVALFAIPVQAQLKKVGQTGLQFLSVDLCARPAAMGGAFNMVGDDASALFYNPACIGYVKSDFDVLFSRTEWIANINYNAIGLVKNLDTKGNIGFSFISADYGDDAIGTRVDNSEKGFYETGLLDLGAFAAGVAYAKQLTDRFAVGGQVRFAYQHLGSSFLNDSTTVKNSVSGLSYDFGTIFFPGFKSLRMGMSINNFSADFKYQEEAFQLPLTFKIGFAMDVLDFTGDNHTNSFLVSIDAIHPRDYSEQLHFGGEYMFSDVLALRIGYKFNYDEQSVTAGLGLTRDLGGLNLKIDYAYSDLGVFEAVNRFSFGLSF